MSILDKAVINDFDGPSKQKSLTVYKQDKFLQTIRPRFPSRSDFAQFEEHILPLKKKGDEKADESRGGEPRTDLLSVDLVELLDQVDDASPDGALRVGLAAPSSLLAGRRSHPPREPAVC
jgi:hypothetical protein